MSTWYGSPLLRLREKYGDQPKVSTYLDGVRDHILKNLNRFKGTDLGSGMVQMAPPALGEPSADPFYHTE